MHTFYLRTGFKCWEILLIFVQELQQRLFVLLYRWHERPTCTLVTPPTHTHKVPIIYTCMCVCVHIKFITHLLLPFFPSDWGSMVACGGQECCCCTRLPGAEPEDSVGPCDTDLTGFLPGLASRSEIRKTTKRFQFPSVWIPEHLLKNKKNNLYGNRRIYKQEVNVAAKAGIWGWFNIGYWFLR